MSYYPHQFDKKTHEYGKQVICGKKRLFYFITDEIDDLVCIFVGRSCSGLRGRNDVPFQGYKRMQLW